MNDTAVTLSDDDADEFVEMLELLRAWFDADNSRLAASFDRRMGWTSATLGSLRDDLGRMIDALGGPR